MRITKNYGEKFLDELNEATGAVEFLMAATLFTL